jgi:hypothetical protein
VQAPGFSSASLSLRSAVPLGRHLFLHPYDRYPNLSFRTSASCRQDEENKISDIGTCTEIVTANAPCRRISPKVGIVIHLRALPTTARTIDRLKKTRNVNVALHGQALTRMGECSSGRPGFENLAPHFGSAIVTDTPIPAGNITIGKRKRQSKVGT